MVGISAKSKAKSQSNKSTEFSKNKATIRVDSCVNCVCLA